jgi:hypothetical protein
MRVKRAALAAVCALAAIGVSAASASAARLTINAAPNPIVAGDAVVVFGHLGGAGNAGQTVTLYHHLPGSPGFTVVQSATTDAAGYYQFNRLPGVVDTNRSWYATADGFRSRTVRERVQALVTLSGPSAATLLTGPSHPYTFTGTVTPAKPGVRVLLQRQDASGSGDHWTTIQRGVVAVGGAFSITHVFVVPGDAAIRALVQSDNRNIASPSTPLEYVVEQTENPSLTINASALPLPVGQTETISGVSAAGQGTIVTLYSATDNTSYSPVAQVTAGAGGAYSFAQTPINSTFYRVKAAGKTSARLFVGVKDQLTASYSATTVVAGTPLTVTGTVMPDKAGHVIDLQQQNASHTGFHTIAVGTVAADSTFQLTQTFTAAGSPVLRVLIPGGPENVGDATAPTTITVTPVPVITTLPTS